MDEAPTGLAALADEQPGARVQEGEKRARGGPLRARNFRLLFGGQTTSVIGDALYLVALPWLVLTTGESA
jgi:hypothetical protein